MSTDKQVDAIYRQAITTFNQRTEKMAEAAMPVISDIVENHGGKGLVRVPITDGKRVFGITVDLEESYNKGCKNIAKAWQKSILLMSIDEAWEGAPARTRPVAPVGSECKLRAERPAGNLQNRVVQDV